MAVGRNAQLAFSVKNKGSEDWPNSFLFFIRGLDGMEVRDVTMDGKDAVEFADAWRLPRLQVGDRAKVLVWLVPEEPGLAEFKWTMWGDEERRSPVPDTAKFVECEGNVLP